MKRSTDMRPGFRAILSIGLAVAASETFAFHFGPPVDNRSHAREYVNTGTGHYLVLTDAAEIANGRAGPGWVATGHRFVVNKQSGMPVCRFYAPAANVHFLTANAAECEALSMPGTGWVFEKIAFAANVPVDGSCAGQTAVHRLYDGRSGVPLHRYVNAATRAGLLDDGWIDEGIAFCSEEVGHDATASERMALGGAPVAANGFGCVYSGCILLGNLAPMERSIPPFAAPTHQERNPEYPLETSGLTGSVFGDLYTAVSSPYPGDVLTHSYVGAGGFHLKGADRTAGVYASIRALREAPMGEPRPWADDLDADVVIATTFRLLRVERGNGHAYGHPTLGFYDRTTGRRIEVTFQAFGTIPPGDFVGADERKVIVSTAMGDTPRFGQVLAGSFVPCANGCETALRTYAFKLRKPDFQRVVELARAADPRLSPAVGDYRIEFFDFKLETYLDARAGVQFNEVMLWLYRN